MRIATPEEARVPVRQAVLDVVQSRVHEDPACVSSQSVLDSEDTLLCEHSTFVSLSREARGMSQGEPLSRLSKNARISRAHSRGRERERESEEGGGIFERGARVVSRKRDGVCSLEPSPVADSVLQSRVTQHVHRSRLARLRLNSQKSTRIFDRRGWNTARVPRSRLDAHRLRDGAQLLQLPRCDRDAVLRHEPAGVLAE